MNWDDCLQRSKRVAARSIGDETFIVAPSESTLHLLPSDVATRIWQLADGRHSLRQIHAAICDEFAVEPSVAQADLSEFVSSLLEKGLVSLAPCSQENRGSDAG